MILGGQIGLPPKRYNHINRANRNRVNIFITYTNSASRLRTLDWSTRPPIDTSIAQKYMICFICLFQQIKDFISYMISYISEYSEVLNHDD